MNQSFWRNNPAFKIAIPFVLGIILAILLQLKSGTFIWLSGVGIMFSGFSLVYIKTYRFRHVSGVLFFPTLLLLGISTVIVKTDVLKDNHFSHHLNKNPHIIGQVDEMPIQKKTSQKAVFKVMYVISGQEVIPVQGKLLVYIQPDSTKKLNYGDIVLFKSKIITVPGPSNPKQFDYRNYLNLNNIYQQSYLKSNQYKIVEHNKGNGVISLGYTLRDFLFEKLTENNIQEEELQVVSALLLGYRELLSPSLIKSYSSTGAMHVLAVSGLHVGILFFILKFSFGFLLKIKRGEIMLTIILISCLWLYALVTGFSPSVLRAATMFSFIVVGEFLLNRKISIYNMLAVSAIVLLLFNPYLIFEVAFQLSYLAVVGIVYLQPRIYKAFSPKYTLMDQAWKITAVSIAAQIATFPLGLYYFHQFPLYFFISNLIVIPLATLILYLGVLFFVTCWIGGFSLVIGKIITFVVFILNESVRFTEKLPFSLISEISISLLDTYILYAFIIMVLVFFHYKKVKYFYIAAPLLFVFMGIQLTDQVHDLQSADFTVYSVRNETVFEFKTGNKSFFCASNTLMENEDQMLFSIKHNWYNKNITHIQHLSIDSLYASNKELVAHNGVFYFKNKCYAYLHDKNIETIRKLSPEVIIVSASFYALLYKLEDTLKNGTRVIFDSSFKGKYVNFWKTRLKNQSVISTWEKYYTEPL